MDVDAGTKSGEIYDVVVVGAGIVGSSSAYHSAKAGKRVLLLEQFTLPHTRGSSHGGNRLILFARTQELHKKLMNEAYPLWKQLEAETNTELIRKRPQLTVSPVGWERGCPADILRAMKEAGGCLEKLSAEEMRLRYPNFIHSDGFDSYVYEGAGIIRANKALGCFQEEFLKRGGVIQEETEVIDIVPGTPVTLRTNQGEILARSIILNPGPWAPQILNKLGLDVPLQVARAHHTFWKEKEPGMYQDFPIFNGVNLDQPFEFSGSPSGEYPGMMKMCKWNPEPIAHPDERDLVIKDSREIELSRQFVREHFPGLEAENGPAIAEACLVTVTPDFNCILDIHPAHDNIVIGCGFSGDGFEFAPITGKILSQLALGDTQTVDVSAYTINRFGK